MSKINWEKQLKIHTTGRDDSMEDSYHHPYEPTDYRVLERLAESSYITKDSLFVDYGCGKGRVALFIAAQTGCTSIGIEFDEALYRTALENKKNCSHKVHCDFYCMSAEKYEVKDANCFFFFHPFSLEVFLSVLGQIKQAYYENPVRRLLFFYYPDALYTAYLMADTALSLVEEISCKDLFCGENHREVILIFELPGIL